MNSRISLEAPTSAIQELIGFLVRRSSAVLALACAISTLLSTSTVASVFVVNSTGDSHDLHPGDGICDSNGTGQCTLRAAIEEANAHAGDDQINFKIPTTDPGFIGDIGNLPAWVINPASALPDLSTNIEIVGPGGNRIEISGNHSFRILNVTTAQTVTLSGIEIDGGVAQLGGGVQNAANATLNITGCVVCCSTANSGGSVCNTGAGTVNILNSAIYGSEAQNNGSGGGIYNAGSGSVTITNSTVAENFLVGNGDGSGIANGSTGTVNIFNSTVSRNAADISASPPTAQVFNAGAGHINVKSSIIATRSDIPFHGLDVSGAFASLGYNLVGIKDTSTGFTQPTDHTGTLNAPLDPGLDVVLSTYGGPTLTVPLLPGSIAINHGNPNSPPRDQRGYTRNGAPDIGAFELGGAIPHTLGNISTRGFVQTGNDVLIAGLIVTGFGQKQVILRALGPTLGQPPFNVPNALSNPVLELRDSTGALIVSNDNWGSASNAAAISASGYAPPNSKESAILTKLNPGNYTAIVRGVNNTTGIALAEGYDLDFTAGSKFDNISTRAFVGTGANVMIAGVIVHGPDSEDVVIRALGPTLSQFGVPNVLADPFLDLRDANGTLIQANNNWGNAANKQAIIDSGLAPPQAAESAILITLSPGNYTAILSGVNSTTGNALLEAYALN